jgi:hypothetical protein
MHDPPVSMSQGTGASFNLLVTQITKRSYILNSLYFTEMTLLHECMLIVTSFNISSFATIPKVKI